MAFAVSRGMEPALRWPVAIAYTLHPRRVRHTPRFFLEAARSLLRGGVRLPARDRVAECEMLFGGIARSVSPETVLEAARLGFFLEAHAGPLKWWTLAERMVVDPSALRINGRLRSQIRNSGYAITLDRDFANVVERCAAPRPGRPPLTWIRKELADVYRALFESGHAHSFEVWDGAGTLVGGGYGLAIGRVFILESMFHGAKNASKIGLVALNHHLAASGFALSDAKAFGQLYDRLGYALVSRAEFDARLDRDARADLDRPGRWTFASDLDEVSRLKPARSAA